MRLVRGVLVLLFVFVVIPIVGFYIVQKYSLWPSLLPAPTSSDQVPRNIADAYRKTQDFWAPTPGASLQFCTNGFSAVYKFGSAVGDGEQEQIFDTAGTLLVQTYIGAVPEDNIVPPRAVWYKLFGTCTDLAPLFQER